MKKKRETLPRVTAMVSWTIYDEIKKITDNIDYSNPVFTGRGKRNHSLGSSVALIVELALTDDEIAPLMRKRLRKFMLNGGKNWFPGIWYLDKY